MVPVLETQRLRLRGHTFSDFDANFAMWGDERVTRHIGGKPSTREEAWARMLRYPGHWALLGYGYWLIEEKDTGAFVGEGGFGNFKREMSPPLDAPEQGWALSPSAWGKGYASEAVAAMLNWGEAHFGENRFCAIIDPTNTASIRVAEKAGYRRTLETAYKGGVTLLFRRG
ncbi:GNAT family N-acetyltransferase [Terricaulis sp.]|uniref:GNAT family N-acetyltransferase n=1 Tax=Terricaulis sp. TaxID=2768686 RepID=UPI003782D681